MTFIAFKRGDIGGFVNRRVPYSILMDQIKNESSSLLCMARPPSKKGEPIAIDAKRFESSAQASAQGIEKFIALGQAEPSTEIKRL